MGRVRGPGLAILAGALILSMSGLASAQDQRFDVQQFNPMPSQFMNYFGMSSGRVLRAGAIDAGFIVNYADDPLVLEDADGERVESIVARQLAINVLGAVGIADFFEIGIDLPIVAYQEDGDSINDVRELLTRPNASGGLGDIRVIPKFQVYTTNTRQSPGGFSLGFLIDTRIPTGDSEKFQGEDFRIEPRIALDLTSAEGRGFSLNLGYMIRTTEATLVNADVGSVFTYGLGVDLPLGGDIVHFVPELAGEANFTADDLSAEELPLELLMGLKIFPADFVLIQFGGGAGLVAGYGSPDWRVFLGLSFAYWPPLDRDGDGILNDDDACPDDPEDFDNWDDEDGCPDLDNDQDTILDVNDECPNDPEDFDDWEDEDGCPDPDNDGDGLRDERDGCPNDPEDYDLFEDEDGCPDPDNDQDRILDVDDDCPLEPENYNDFEDEDGCYDEVEVTVTCEAIVIRDKVYFEYDSDVIQPRSYSLLDQVARIMDRYQEIRLVEIQGHTDERGRDSYNLDLSQRRADSVMRYLVERGIDPARMVARGYGETDPINPESNEEAWAQNRRVEFIILEGRAERCEE